MRTNCASISQVFLTTAPNYRIHRSARSRVDRFLLGQLRAPADRIVRHHRTHMPRQTLYKAGMQQLEPWPPAEPQGAPLSDEPAREVYLVSCAAIASQLALLGFKYTKSKQRCARASKGFGNAISFQSSHFNSSGRHVQLWMYATVSSDELKVWRSERLPADYASDHVAGGMVHLLGSRYALVQWELADPKDRLATVADAVAFIHQEVLPYFALFAEPSAVISHLHKQSLPGLDLIASVEFAYCFGTKQSAQRVLDRFMSQRVDIRPLVEAAQARAMASPILRPGDYGEQVVFLRTRHDLN